jgi:hypothetical protein
MESILLDFYFDRRVIDQARIGKRTKDGRHRYLPDTEELFREISLSYEDFWMPARVNIGGLDLFHCGGGAHERFEAIHGPGPSQFPKGHVPCPWMWTSLALLATSGLVGLKRAIRYGTGGYTAWYQGALEFRCDGELAMVEWKSESGTEYRCSEIVSAHELLDEWRAFSERVRLAFLAEAPELIHHTTLGRWFSYGVDFLHADMY